MPKRISEKPAVFLKLFKARYDPAAKTLRDPLVSLREVKSALGTMAAAGETKLSDANAANFIKDYLRSSTRSANWPPEILAAGYTAKQRTGEGQCFEFVALAPGEDPFPDDFLPTGDEPTFIAQTLSLPVTTRDIVRKDEQSVAQIAVKLHVLEHFLASSPKANGWGVREITHLQNNVKLSSSEIDSLYQVVAHTDRGTEIGAVAVEVKIGDPIIAEQIEKQALAILQDESFAFCIPAILKRFKKGELIAMHLDPVRREDVQTDGTLHLGAIAYSARYVFAPPLPKI